MIAYTTRWLLAALLSASFWSAAASSEHGHWQEFIDNAVEAFVDGDYVGAGRSFDAAVKRAEEFGPQDPRLATSLNGLAEVYRAQELYADAEPLYKRALAIREKALRPGHPSVVQSLRNLAGLYWDQGRRAEAEPLSRRANELEAEVKAQTALWQSYMTSSIAAYQQGKYGEAVDQSTAALSVAETFGPEDTRLATSLNNLVAGA